jgi:molybdenum cofactor cytidylyltransferase
MAEGIILAAGKGSRTQTNKVLLTINDQSLLLHAIQTMKPHVTQIFVITGYYDQSIKAHLKDQEGVICVYNENYEMGMFSSVLKGVMKTNEDIFILPADCPFVSEETYQKLLKHKGEMRVPVYQGRKGHPLFIVKELVLVLKKESVHSNLKQFRNRYPYTLVETNDEMVLVDIDTIEAFEKIKRKVK